MILVDTSVWIDHLATGHPTLAALLERGQVVAHPWVIGELAQGQLSGRREVLGLLAQLPQAIVATTDEVLAFVERHELHGAGIGYVDAQLLAATKLTTGTALWTKDRRLRTAAARLRCAVDPAALGSGRA